MLDKEYIERNSLIKNLRKFAPEQYTDLINQLILKQPIADVQPVVHAEWKEIIIHNGCTPDYDCVCSNCKERNSFIQLLPSLRCKNGQGVINDAIFIMGTRIF